MNRPQTSPQDQRPTRRSHRRPIAIAMALVAGVVGLVEPGVASGQTAASIDEPTGPIYADGVVSLSGTCPTDPGVGFLDVVLEFSDPTMNTTTPAEVNGTTWSAGYYLGRDSAMTMTATVQCDANTDPAARTFDILAPTLDLVATVGTEPGVCATTSSIEVVAGTPVYWCYTATSNSSRDHYGVTVSDDVDGELFSDSAQITGPGDVTSSVDMGLQVTDTPSADMSRTGTWTIHNCDGDVCPEVRSAQATAEVVVVEEEAVEVTDEVVTTPPAVPVPASPTFTG